MLVFNTKYYEEIQFFRVYFNPNFNFRTQTDEKISVSAMSGVSSASGGSMLGTLPEEDCGNDNNGGQVAAQSPPVLRRTRTSSFSSR